MQWKEAQSRFVWWAFTGVIAAIFAGLGWVSTQVLARPTMVEVEKALTRVETTVAKVLLSRNDVAAIVRTESPYNEDKKLILRQFENTDHLLQQVQNDLKSLQRDIVELKLLINRQSKAD